MEPEVTPRKLRLVSGTVAEVEHELNGLLKDYAAMMWNFAPLGAAIVVTVVLIHKSEIRMQQMMAGAQGRPN